MKKTIEECPKTVEAYKKWLVEGLKKQYPEQNIEVFTGQLIELSIIKSPIACVYFFDTLNIIGTIEFDHHDRKFIPCVNSIVIDAHEDHQHFEDRKEAEEALIKYLFIETEKTL